MSSVDVVSIEVDRRLFSRLQSIARPLLDDVDAVLERLLDHWESSEPQKSESEKKFWYTSRGERFSIGTKLRATYKDHEFEAVVMKTGIYLHQNKETYSSPSSAAIEAKVLAGLLRESANTNGWRFWEYYDDNSDSWQSLEKIRFGSYK